MNTMKHATFRYDTIEVETGENTEIIEFWMATKIFPSSIPRKNDCFNLRKRF